MLERGAGEMASGRDRVDNFMNADLGNGDVTYILYKHDTRREVRKMKELIWRFHRRLEKMRVMQYRYYHNGIKN